VNVGTVTPEFKRLKGVHLLVTSRRCAISRLLSFIEAISTQFCFTYSLGGVTSMLRISSVFSFFVVVQLLLS